MSESAQKTLILSLAFLAACTIGSVGGCAYHTDKNVNAAKVECLKKHDPGECARLFASGSRQ